MATYAGHLNLNPNGNSYLQERNKKFYRGHSNMVHPLYDQELKNAITSITSFLNYSILRYAYFKRLNAIYSVSAEKCYNNKSNNYSYSEAEVCEEVMIEKDVVLTNIKQFEKEVEVRLQDAYEKQVKFASGNFVERDGANFSAEKYEKDHRRYYYYFTARKLFLDSWQQ